MPPVYPALDNPFTAPRSDSWDNAFMITFVLLMTGCVHQAETLEQPFRFEARTTHGVIRVMPPLATCDPTELSTASYVGPPIPWMREWLRSRRIDEIDGLPAEVGMALPGALNAALGSTFDGTFLMGELPGTTRAAVRSALRGKGDLDATLSAAARGIDGSAALFTWVESVDARPLTAEGFAGDILETDAGPVVLDFFEEPYLIEAEIGLALVARDGEVVVRYAEHFSTVLSARRPSRRAAKDLALALATEVAKVWATDPRLEDDAPSDSVAMN